MAQGNLLLNIAVKNQQALGKVNNQLTQLQNSGIKLGTVLKGAAAGLAAIGATKLIGSIISTTARFEDLGDALASVTGSAQAGAEAFDFVSSFATKTQFGVEDLTQTFIKLKASGIEPTEDLLTLFTDTAAITTDQIGSLQAITDLFARTTSGGLGLEELNRLADRGVPVFRILEEQLGITRLQISNVGKTAEGSQKILAALSAGIRKDFGGATARVTDNLSTQFSNFSIELKNVANEFGKGLSPQLAGSTQALTEFLGKNKELIGTLGELTGKALQALITGLSNTIEFFRDLGETVFNIVQRIKQFGNTVRGFIPFINKAEAATVDFDTANRNLHKGYTELAPVIVTTANTIQDQKVAVEEATKTFKFYDDAIIRSKRSQDAAKRSAEALNELFEQDVMLQALQRTIGEGFTPLEGQIQVVTNSMGVFRDTASSALTDVIFGTKKLDDALGEIAKATLRALIQGFINLGLTIFVLEPLERFLRGQVQAQKQLNNELRRTIALETALAAIKGVGSFFGLPFFADGGKTGANQPIVVGERGPEVFVPNTSGTVIPNDEIGMSGQRGVGGGDNIEVTFNINTIDATDFDQLLTTRQDLIIGLINRGLAERGRRSLTA